MTPEGTAKPDQLAAVIDLGCDRGQGFILANPFPASEALAALVAEPARDVPGLLRASAA